ncbi:MAG: hypothetical protein HYY30_11340, partial [Chloroflexi bacterium]|nr:hypothetical protein [Chloroflexota bacterium]
MLKTVKRRLRNLRLAVNVAGSTLMPRSAMQFPPYDGAIHDHLATSDDYVRYGTIALAINTIRKENIAGSFAEVGVYRGNTSRIIHSLAPDKKLYLFDTFEGFPQGDVECADDRFQDTSIEVLKATIGDLHNIVIRKGYFPETTQGLESESFAFVM